MGAYDDILNETPKKAKRGTYDDILEGNGSTLGDIVGGLTRSGMGVVSNLMRPLEAMIPGGNDFNSGHKQRMDRVEGRFKAKGYDTNSLAFKGGKLAGDVAITAPVGGALAAGAKYVPGLTKAVPGVEMALRTGGFRLGTPAATTLAGKAGNAALRAGAGAAVGGAQTGLVNLDDTGTGAVVGGAMPAALKVAGKAGSLAKQGGSALVRNVVGMSTGAGGDAVGAAYQAGKAGNRAFVDHMRGGSADDIVAQAREAIGNMRAERAAAYRSGMVDIGNDMSVIDFTPISKAINGIRSMGSYKGQQINKNAAGTVDDITNTVNKWASLDPSEYHTPEGLDALKRALGDIRDATQFGTPARRAADSAYNAVKAEINKQAPSYAKVMKDYTDASEALREVEKAFSTGEKASKDTTLRKLLSVMRNNVNTNFGNRMELAQRLSDNGAPDLLPSIAGQAMSSNTPRGLQGLAATGAGVAGLSNPAFLAALPFQSPRLMGEAAYGLGRLTGGAGNIATAGGNAVRNSLPPGLLSQQEIETVLRSFPLLSISTSP